MTAQTLLSGMTDKQILEQWLILDQQPANLDIYTVRGWYMDELEKRFPVEFDNYIENCEGNDDITHYIKL